MRLSIATWSFHKLMAEGKMDWLSYLDDCQNRYQLTTADFWSGFFPELTPEFFTKVSKELGARQLDLVNLAWDHAMIWHDDADKRKEYEKSQEDALRATEILGARSLRIDAGVHHPVFENRHLDYIVPRYQWLCKRAEDIGIKLGSENHGHAAGDARQLIRLYDLIQEKAYGFLMHAGRFNGDADEGRDLLAKATFHVHVCRSTDLPQAISLIKCLNSVSYTGAIGVEEQWGVDEREKVDELLTMMKQAMQSV